MNRTLSYAILSILGSKSAVLEAATPESAGAADFNIPEIVVTAQRRSENLQNCYDQVGPL